MTWLVYKKKEDAEFALLVNAMVGLFLLAVFIAGYSMMGAFGVINLGIAIRIFLKNFTGRERESGKGVREDG